MSNQDLLKRAAARMEAATELLNQLLAAQSFEHQGLVDEQESYKEVQRLVSEFSSQTDEVSQLINEFLANKGEVESSA
jgi:hypothetical protein